MNLVLVAIWDDWWEVPSFDPRDKHNDITPSGTGTPSTCAHSRTCQHCWLKLPLQLLVHYTVSLSVSLVSSVVICTALALSCIRSSTWWSSTATLVSSSRGSTRSACGPRWMADHCRTPSRSPAARRPLNTAPAPTAPHSPLLKRFQSSPTFAFVRVWSGCKN